MYYSIPIKLDVYNKINHFVDKTIEGSEEYVLFRDLSEKYTFLLVHGTSTGKVTIQGFDFTIEEILKFDSLFTSLKKKNIKEIFTISCFGGLQKLYTRDGITISSCHDSKEEIVISPVVTLDNEYFLDIHTNN